MEPYFKDATVTLHHGDCLDIMRAMPDASVDSVCCDPPYGLANTDPAHVAETIMRWVNGDRDYLPGGAGFMGEAWDAFVPPVAVWDECLRVLKPGGHVLAFAGSRTVDLMTLGLRLAGFDIRDSIAWMYGSGFPKSLDVSKAIDKQRHDGADIRRVTAWVAATRTAAGVTNRDIDAAFGFNGMAGHWTTQGAQAAIPTLDQVPRLLDVLKVTPEDVPDEIRAALIDLNGLKGQPGPAWFEREVLATERRANEPSGIVNIGQGERVMFDRQITAPATDAARTWQGWGSAMKPAHEPVVCARKPFNAVPLGEEVDRLHHLIGGLLWLSLSPAKRAALTSPSSQAAQHEAPCVSALVSAALNTSPDASGETATYSSPALASTSLSIVSSWSATLDALSARTKTSTTSTASSTTTALRTLSSLLGPITSQTTMPRCGCLLAGPSSPAPSAASSSSDEWAKWLHTLSASVPATATEGIALAVASALASIADELSDAQAAASSAARTATTEAAASRSAFEPVVVARKPFKGTLAANVLAHGTGALNIDGCRVGADGGCRRDTFGDKGENAVYGAGLDQATPAAAVAGLGRWPANVVLDEGQAAELDEQSGVLKSGAWTGKRNGSKFGDQYGTFVGDESRETPREASEGGASRFFFIAREDNEPCPSTNDVSTAASPSSRPSEHADFAPSGAATTACPAGERLTGSPSTSATPSESRPNGESDTPTTTSTASASSLDSQPARPTPTPSPASSAELNPPTDTTTTTTSPSTSDGSADLATSSTTPTSAPGVPLDGLAERFRYVAKAPTEERPRVNGIAHPTTKPLSLMRWLVRLVTPPGGTVLEPFAGSGTTVEACILEGFRCIAIEREDTYLPLIRQRIARRRDPVEAVRGAGEDGGLFDLLDDRPEGAA